MSSAHTRAQAKRNTLLAKGTALLLAGIAVAAIAIGLPGVSAPEGAVQSVSDLLAERQAEQERLDNAQLVEDNLPAREVDLLAIADRLEVIHPPAPAEPIVAAPEGPEIVNTDGSEKIEIRYLGHITEPNRQLALVSLNGRQRIIPAGTTTTFTPEGGSAVSVHIVDISDSALVYDLDGERQRLDKAPRLASSITKIQGNEQAPGGPGIEPPQAQGEESDVDRRRREAMERRQQYLEREGRDRRGDGEN